eukprot:Gregarina_sp_Poly_1__7779@NODE_43_length_18077_cov_117_559078_g37_i0_p15_GENE_NODE_43_length_18077_cov_117_559078_g37_i0NODE_43_length_18077_cov_117_559078_g37_i0_p15_ORF_typecomplete_len157_score16_21_NODE_43_length_18077_cov_117_559078_g37_i0964810118
MADFICNPNILNAITQLGWFLWNTGLWRPLINPVRNCWFLSAMPEAPVCISAGCGYPVPPPPGQCRQNLVTASEAPVFGLKGPVNVPLTYQPSRHPPQANASELHPLIPPDQAAPSQVAPSLDRPRTDMDHAVEKINEVRSKLKDQFCKLTNKFGR